MEEDITKTSKFPKHKELVGKIKKGDEKIMHKMVISLLGVLLILVVFNALNASITGNVVGVKIAETKEANRPAEIRLKVINTDCIDCFDISQILDYIRGTNVKIINEETFSANSEKARELILSYDIKKLPTVLVSGEINKTKLKGFIDSGDSLVYEGMTPPYADAITGDIKGRVKIINVVDSLCEKCISLKPISDAFAQAGVAIVNVKNVEYNSQEGKSLIDEYEMSEIPSMLISKEIDYYNGMKKQIASFKPAEKNGFYKIHSTLPPFRNLTNNKLVGLVDIIYLEDMSCEKCYDVKTNKGILARLGISANSEKTYDVGSPQGRQLIDKYDIKKVPIVLVSPEAKDYVSFSQVWLQVGSVENDGWFVMRKPELVGTYKGLESGKIINPKKQQAKIQAGKN